MNQREVNPFAKARLLYPLDQQPEYERFCQTDNQSSLDRSPFVRRVDMWFAALCVAARAGLPPADLSKRRTTSFVEGDIFDRDPWRIRAIMLLAIATDKTIEVVDNPARMIAIANGYAATGAPLIVEMLTDGYERPIWNLSEALNELLTNP